MPFYSLIRDFAQSLKNGACFPLGEYPGGDVFRIGTILSNAVPGTVVFEKYEIQVNPLDPTLTRISVSADYFTIGDIFLLFLPALTARETRTVLTVRGVTHGEGVSVSAIRGSLRDFLARRGTILAVNARGYSFAGDLSGEVEFRLYPREVPAADDHIPSRPLVFSSPGLAEEAGRYRGMAEEISGSEAALMVIHGAKSPGLYVVLPPKGGGGLCHDFDILHDETGFLRGENFFMKASGIVEKGYPAWYLDFTEMLRD